MSTFDGFIPEILGISVDKFLPQNLESSLFFLSHCHQDHMVGLKEASEDTVDFPGKLYASPISVVFLKQQFPRLEDHLVELDIGHPKLIHLLNDSQDDSLYVTALPAGHCPGSVMFLFETNTFKILYTGDIRLSVGSYKKMQRLHTTQGTPKVFNNIYLDTTFFDEDYKYFPSQFESFEEIFRISNKWLKSNSKNIVLLQLPAKYGSEFVFIELAKRTSMPIHVSQDLFDQYKYISEIDKSVTLDASVTRIHACQYNKSCEDYHEGSNKFKLLIKPSAMFWKNWQKDKPISNINENCVRVCYSSHASFQELQDFLNYFQPKTFTPCVVLQKYEFADLVNKVMFEISNRQTKENKMDLYKGGQENIKKEIYVINKIIKRKFTQVPNPEDRNNACLKKHNFDSELWDESDLIE